MTSLTRRRVAFAVVLAAIVSTTGLLRAGTPQAVGTWRSLGAVPDARVGAAAVALPDGRVLITGGSIDGAATAAVSIFNPSDGSFTSAGQLLLPRSGHTATLLKDGRVLIAGGVSQGATTTDLELFDPANQTSTIPGSMTAARTGHAAALLTDGRILISGGSGVDGVLDTSDVFDPSDNSVTATALHMLSPRTGASATTLIDGRVLIAGGNDGTKDLATAEIFDPGSMTFEETTTPLSVPRSGHTAVLLPWNGSVLIAGGTSNGVAQTATDLFVPAQFPDPYSWGMGSFAPTGPLAQPRAGAVGAPHIEGYSVVLGGGATDAEVYRFATLKTDKDDYAPGTQAIITGAGWQPDTDVTLLFQEDPAVHDDYVLTVHADTDGKIYWDQWAPEEHDLNVRFYLLAKQVLADGSERRAQITFTDGNATSVSGTVRSSAAGNPVLSGVTVTCTSGCNGTPSTTTNTGGAYVFSNSNKLSFGTNGPVTLVLTASKPGFASSSIGLNNVNNGDSFSGEDFTLNPSIATTVLSVQPASGSYGGTVNLSATLTAGGSGVTGKNVSFTLNGTSVGTSPTNGSGVASLSGVSLGAIAVGAYSNAIAASFAGDSSFTASSGSGTLTVSRANQTTVFVSAPAAATYGQSGLFATVSGGSGTGAYSFSAGTSTACSVDASTGALTLTSGTGDCAITATRAGDANYNDSAASAPAVVAVGKAAAVITVSGYTGVYDGAAHGATGSAKGLNNVDLSAELHLGSTFTNVPGGTANWTFDGDANYAAQSGQVQVVITKATPVVTVSFPSSPVIYDGNPHEATAHATLVTLPEDGTLTVAYTPAGPPVNAGAYSASAHFTSLSQNFNDADSVAAATLTINKADATVSVEGYTGTYDGDAHGATGTATGVKGESLAAGLNFGATFTDVPGGTAHWTFTGGTNYNDTSGDAAITINKANATVSVEGYTGTYDGNAHGATGTATGVKGESLAAGLDFGAAFTNAPGGTAHWTFNGGVNYNGQTGDVAVTIARASAIVTVTCPSNVTYTGAALTPCSAKATGVGGLDQSLNPLYTDNLNAGLAQAGANFIGDVNHDPNTGSAAFTIDKAASTVVVTCPASKVYTGNAQTPCSAGVTGVGGLDQSLAPSYVNNVTVGTATANAAFGGDPNHLGSSGSQTFTITPKTLTITAKDETKTLGSAFSFVGTEFLASGLVASDSVTSVTLTSVGAASGAGVGTYPILPGNAVGTGLTNYAISYVNGTLTVGYGVCALYDQAKAVKQNATVPVKFYLCTASGQDVSSSAVVVTATQLTPTSGSAAADVEDSGNANPDNNFRFDPTLGPSGGYIFNLSTKGVPAAMWKLTFTVNGAQFGTYTLGFGVK